MVKDVPLSAVTFTTRIAPGVFSSSYGTVVTAKVTALVSFGGVSVKVAPGAGNAVDPLASCSSPCQV